MRENSVHECTALGLAFAKLIDKRRVASALGTAIVTCHFATALAADAIRSPPLSGGPQPPSSVAGRSSHDGIGITHQELAATIGAIWSTTVIPVCWENPSPADVSQRADVQAQIQATWEANSLVTFIGWGQCNSGSKGVRIETGDFHPHTEGLGTQLDGRPAGMKLNFTWSGCAGNTVGCVRWVAAHEFGHALGFNHEQDRPDAPMWCKDSEYTGGSPDIYMTPYDPQSIMNYCNLQWNNNGMLSADDVAGAQFWYGPSPHSGNPWLVDCRTSVLLFQNKNFGGKSLLVNGTVDDLAAEHFNDRASSLCVPAGFILKAFSDKGFKGSVATFNGPTMVSALTTGNDKFSSVVMIDAVSGNVVFDAPPDCDKNAIIYQDSHFRGKSITVTESIVDFSSPHVSFGDKASSICVPAGHTLVVFKDKNFGGQSVSFVGPAFRTNLDIVGMNDAISSVKFN